METYRMDPEPRTMTSTLGTRRHPLRYSEVGEPVPDACLVHAEYGKVLRLDSVDIRFVRDGQCAPLHVVQARSVILRRITSGAWVVALLDITALGAREPRCRTLVASNLRCRDLSGGEIEDIARVWWIVEMAMEPPLVERVVRNWGDGPVVVWKSVIGDIETVHARMPDR